MSIETVATTSTISEKSEESLLERRTRLHREAAVIGANLHELETRHHKLILGLIALSDQLKVSSTEADINTHIGITDERDELAATITTLRQVHRDLIDETAKCNNSIQRERPEEFSGNKNWREQRRIEEIPYVIQVHNDGEDPTDTTAINALDEESLGSKHRYLTNAVI